MESNRTPRTNAERQKLWRENNPEKAKSYWNGYYRRNITTLRESAKQRAKERRLRERELVFGHYGWECACCKESEPYFLTIDHIRNDGNIERKTFGEAGSYGRIIKAGYPENYQTLCYNCNITKGILGKCPHQS